MFLDLTPVPLLFLEYSTKCLCAQLEELEEKDLGTLIRVPQTRTTDPEAASDAEIPETSGPAKRKRAAPSGPASKRAYETPSATAT
jgi:hypothetical protein